ncbi:PREDICTED: uncharacterized protein LOC108369239 isoform X8 [Rhagoletis zephyria]|uniref:uncharacterized protein LOC108369239 isoform X8 n=1 Tax=Rhagoletis zephyria TaxID=28612 RepID=UPI00081129C5|nr:PREDICTED: uncharacterized protein LOC108369239 isoform X8 [Rhagoletis zephyria]
MFSKLWFLICATQLVIIKGTYDPANSGIKTRSYHRDLPNAEQQNQPSPPYTNTHPRDSRFSPSYDNTNYGAPSLRLSPPDSHQHIDGPHRQQQQRPSYQHQQPHSNPQQAESYQQREQPIFNRPAHVRLSPPSERQVESAWSGTENSIGDYNSGCPPQHTGPVPYPYDCRRFVNCWHGRGHIQSCGPGTVFNPETLECDRPDKVVCGTPGVNGVSSELNVRQTTLQTASNPNKYRAGRLVDVSTGNVDSLCPAGVNGLAPHPTDCTKFLNCANGNTHVQNCGPGTAYSISMKTCDFKEKVDCSGRENGGNGALSSRDGRQYENNNYDNTRGEENGSNANQESDIFCPPGVIGLFPHPFDYTRFLNCKLGNTAIQNCMPGSVYSISRNYCDLKEKTHYTDHVDYVISEQQQLPSTMVSCPPNTDGNHLYPYDSTKFITCRQGRMSIDKCGSPKVFSISAQTCRPESEVNIGDRVRNAVAANPNVEIRDSRNLALNYVGQPLDCPQGQSGLYPHPFDCRKFMLCRNGKLSVESCKTGNVFSLSAKHCDPKELVNVNEQVQFQLDVGQDRLSESDYNYINSNREAVKLICPQNMDGLFLHPFDCTKYLSCHNGQSQVGSCPPGKVFSISRRQCINRNQVDAYDRVEYLSEVKHEFSTELSQGNNNQLLETTCPPDANSVYPYPYDNTKYIKCSRGHGTIENCVKGMIFSTTRRYCDYETKVNEYDRNWRSDNGYDNHKAGADVQEAGVMSEREPKDVSADADVECPPKAIGTYPHPYDCRKFLACSHGVTQVKQCAPGTAWSAEMEVCDFEKNVNCVQGTKLPNTAANTIIEDKVACPPNMQGLFLHPFNAQHFVNCNNGETFIQTCQTGSVFSISQRMCLAAREVTPVDRVQCSQDYATDIPSYQNYIVCPAQAVGYFVYPFDGLLYIECLDGRTLIQNCAQNTVFSISNQICIPTDEAESTDYVWLRSDWQHINPGYTTYDHKVEWSALDTNSVGAHTQSSVDSTQSTICAESESGLYPHPTDCKKFLRCANGISYEMDCGPGTAFNAALEVCDFENKVDCSGRLGIGDLQVRNSPAVACPVGASGVYPHPLDCKKFLHCDNGIATIKDCGPGTAWNVKMETCDFMAKVGCADGGVRQEETREDNGGHGYDANTHFQAPAPQSNNRNPTRNEWRSQPNSAPSHHRGTYDSQSYGGIPTTPSSRTNTRGDRWFNMDRQRPVPHDDTRFIPEGTYNPDYDRQQRLPVYGKDLRHNNGPASWAGTSAALDRQTPTQSVIYEEGSLEPNREQHSLITNPTENSVHASRTDIYSKNTKQESKNNPNWHNRGHNREFHRTHPNLLNPFHEVDQSRPHNAHSHGHNHNHNRAFHERHPEMPNPFATPVTLRTVPTTTNNFDLTDANPPNTYAESTTPFSVRPEIDLRAGQDVDCQFDCGNGKCVKSFEVCNGINNCGNRKDEDNCKHLGYEVRLAGGESANMGRVEVKILGKWGYVCDDKFGLRDAEVVCREVGFKLGASEVRGYSYYPPTETEVSFVMDEVDCRGDESSLRECNFKGWGVSNCGPDEVVGVVCKVPQLKCPNNYWLCSTSQECIPPAFVCDHIPDCADKSDESDNVCNSPVEYRLQGGRSPSEGRLEVRYRGEWGTVCDDDFGLKEAQVICNSMGFYGLPTIAKNVYGPGSGPIWLDQVSCFGNETSLEQCNHWTWGEHNCNHTEDVGLKCTVGVQPQKVSTPQADRNHADGNGRKELDDPQQELEDIGLFSEWERKSKAIGTQRRRCGQFKDDLLDEYAHPEERVVNGSLAKRGHHPWQATIRTRGRGGISSHWCGAVLISSRHLLTAAHCLAGYPKGAYLVRLGDHYANIAEASEIDSFIENWYVHEKFRDATHMNNDIAMIVLKTPVKFNDYIQPVCLPSKDATVTENRKCTISGWGSIKSGVSTPSNILRAAELPILSDDVCKQPHVYGASLTEGMFCAGYMDESVDACDGDSGGPLICHDEDGETLYGIISWGQHCGYANKPGVYVRVEKYVDWIMDKINFSIQNAT